MIVSCKIHFVTRACVVYSLIPGSPWGVVDLP